MWSFSAETADQSQQPSDDPYNTTFHPTKYLKNWHEHWPKQYQKMSDHLDLHRRTKTEQFIHS